MVRISPLKNIRRYCKEQCCAGDMKSWKFCSAKGCFLWIYRLGKRATPSDIKEAELWEKQHLLPTSFERNTYISGDERDKSAPDAKKDKKAS